MYPVLLRPRSGTSTPHEDDIAGLSTLYPAADFLRDARGTITGDILGANGTTKLTGVNVIARNVPIPSTTRCRRFRATSRRLQPIVGVAGSYTLRGLTPGAQYAVFVDEILAGGFSTPPLTPAGARGVPQRRQRVEQRRDRRSGRVHGRRRGRRGDRNGINIIFNAPEAGDPLPVGDDGSVELFLPFTFELCGQSFDSVFVNANGTLTFGAATATSASRRFEFLDGPPRAAGIWDDLNPVRRRHGHLQPDRPHLHRLLDDVPEFPMTGANTFSIKLYRLFDRVDLSYGGMTAVDGLAGVSCGGRVTSRFEVQQDLSRFAIVELLSDPAGFELFSPSRPFDLANSQLRFTGTINYSDNWAGANDTLATAKRIPAVQLGERAAVHRVREGWGRRLLQVPGEGRANRGRRDAHRPMDTLLGLFDSAGNLLAIDDDSAPARCRGWRLAPADGDYVIGVTKFPDFGFTGAGPGQTGRYVLSVQALAGTLLPVGDDRSRQVAFGFSFPFQGTTWTASSSTPTAT